MQETKAREELLAAERAAEQALREKELDLLRENLEKTEREAEAAKEALEKGRRPVVEPTQEEWQAAKERINYNPAKLHFAVCGTSGSGKSSLIVSCTYYILSFFFFFGTSADDDAERTPWPKRHRPRRSSRGHL